MNKMEMRNFNSNKKYYELTEIEKIPLRIQRAKELAIIDLTNGVDLNCSLNWCIENEQYCAAEGIKQALKQFKNNPCKQ